MTGVDHQSLDDESYAYDENGNRTGTGYVTAADNRLESDGTYTYGYDAEGNLVSKTKTSVTGNEVKYTTYTWDYRNRLTETVCKNSSEEVVQTVQYTYDAFDRRITRTVLDGDDETVLAERYVYDGNAIVLVLDGSGAVNERCLQGPDIDQPLAEEDASGDVRWFLADPLGTVRDVVDSDGGLLDHVSYDTFGNVLSQEQPRFAFAGRELDAESGLYYNRLRYYDPGTGRFISEDPIGFAGGDANLYRYALNSPLNLRDPAGLDSLQDASDGWDKLHKKGTTETVGKIQASVDGAIGTPSAAGVKQPKSWWLGCLAGFFSRLLLGGGVNVNGSPGAPGEGEIQTTAHGAERIAGAGATRGGVLSEAEITAARAGTKLTQADGAVVRVLEGPPGRFNVVVEGERGVITTFKNLSQESLDRLAKNYGWK